METVVPMVLKTEEKVKPMPQLIIGTVPCGTGYEPLHRLAWKLIKPYVDDLANKTQGEYTSYKVKTNLWSGQASLHLGYMDDSGEVTADNVGDMVVKHLINNPKKDFVGYIITRLDPDSIHIWQVVVMPEYQNTNAFKLGYGYLEGYFKEIGDMDITFSTLRDGWHKQCQELGFTEIYTVYRKSLKDKK